MTAEPRIVTGEFIIPVVKAGAGIEIPHHQPVFLSLELGIQISMLANVCYLLLSLDVPLTDFRAVGCLLGHKFGVITISMRPKMEGDYIDTLSIHPYPLESGPVGDRIIARTCLSMIEPIRKRNQGRVGLSNLKNGLDRIFRCNHLGIIIVRIEAITPYCSIKVTVGFGEVIPPPREKAVLGRHLSRSS